MDNNQKLIRAAIIGLLTQHSYLATWDLVAGLGIDPGDFGGCGPPGPGDDAIRALVDQGIIEELPDLGCRYRLVGRRQTEELSAALVSGLETRLQDYQTFVSQLQAALAACQSAPVAAGLTADECNDLIYLCRQGEQINNTPSVRQRYHRMAEKLIVLQEAIMAAEDAEDEQAALDWLKSHGFRPKRRKAKAAMANQIPFEPLAWETCQRCGSEQGWPVGIMADGIYYEALCEPCIELLSDNATTPWSVTVERSPAGYDVAVIVRRRRVIIEVELDRHTVSIPATGPLSPSDARLFVAAVIRAARLAAEGEE